MNESPSRGNYHVVTGATSGLGKAIALGLAARGANLILTGRNESAGARVAERARRLSNGAKARFIRADLSDQKAVRELAARIQEITPRLNVLINNAGARFEKYLESVDGIEMTFATNHLGHFLLTTLLAESLKKNSGRVITVGSRAHYAASDEGGWILSADRYDPKKAYNKSKLANIVFAYEFAARMKGSGVTSNAVDPGLPVTGFGRNNGLVSWLKHIVYHGLRRELTSASRAAEPIIRLATAPEFATRTAGYFRDGQEIKSNPCSYEKSAAESLWAVSLASLK
jgi:NAD(P)-dependent dehydrogenase (short-subunit alcohol dehydrogenase family)